MTAAPRTSELHVATANKYIRDYSFLDLLSTSVLLYYRHFGSLFLAFFLLVFPLFAIHAVSERLMIPVHWSIDVAGSMAVCIALAVITILVSDICLYNRPSLRQAFGRLRAGRLLRLVGTSFLQATMILAILAGLLLLKNRIAANSLNVTAARFLGGTLIVIGLAALARYMLACVVAAVEFRCWGFGALRRSSTLSRGSRGRTTAVLIIFFSAYAAGLSLAETSIDRAEWLSTLLLALALCVLTPLVLITFALSYYDLRVRNEGYDADSLAEDLMR
jgi:hypothetical protein